MEILPCHCSFRYGNSVHALWHDIIAYLELDTRLIFHIENAENDALMMVPF
jgi:hypothetical protein